jgi:hypothetical protein
MFLGLMSSVDYILSVKINKYEKCRTTKVQRECVRSPLISTLALLSILPSNNFFWNIPTPVGLIKRHYENNEEGKAKAREGNE